MHHEATIAVIPLFSRLSKKQLAEIAKLMTTIDVEAGRELMHQGEPGQELCIVVDGEADVVRDGTVIATRGPGAFLGEIALLLDRPRTASVIAKTDMTIEVLDRREFKRLLELQPAFYEPLLEAVAQRLAEQDDLLSH